MHHGKGGVKLHTLYDVKTDIPAFVVITDAALHDSQVMGQKDSFYVFDRAYMDTKMLYLIHKREAFFVVREKHKMVFDVVEYKDYNNPATGVMADQIIRFRGNKTRKSYPETLRRVIFYDREGNRTFVFYTNNFDITAEGVALLYKFRWRVELFFKWLKQPVVLGYIVAGFIASPNMPYMPSVTDLHGIHIWSDIGVIFLLFALGLEFSFKKILKMGAAPIIAACAIILGMILVGISTGKLFGWSQMDCIYLGGMLAMSSTTIIFKAFDDLGLRQKRFASLVLSVLIIEDILAIVLMVMLSTLAVSQEFEGTQMLMSILKLTFFLILWFTVGLFLIPLFLRKMKPVMSNETLLITSLALCLGMVVLASAVGFSAAFGAFIMGSILAETVEAEQIEHLVTPIKDFFGAIFFVSVGMMVDVAIIVEYIVPILCIIVSIMLGQTILSTGGFLLAGQPLKTAMQCSFSLTQIGEFAFILAALGTSLHVTSDFLYPIVVAVSVFTTFTTPYMIRFSASDYEVVERTMPARLREKLERNNYEEEVQTEEQYDAWRSHLRKVLINILIYGVLSIAAIGVMLLFVKPLIERMIPDPWSGLVTAATTLIASSPFLWTLMFHDSLSEDMTTLWKKSRESRIRLFALQLLRMVIGAAFVAFILNHTVEWMGWLVPFVVIGLVFCMTVSPLLRKRSEQMTNTLAENLAEREALEQQKKQ